MKINLSILKRGEIVRLITLLVCIQLIPAGTTLELEAMSHIGKKLIILSWRLTIYAGSYDVNSEKSPLLALEQTQVKMVITGQGHFVC